MKNWALYRLALQFLPRGGGVNETDLPPEAAGRVEAILKKHRCLGAVFCLFDFSGVGGALAFGVSHPTGERTGPDTVFRAASVSKFVTALGAMKLKEQGRVDLDRDVGDYLPGSVMDAWRPTQKITLRMLLTHTAGLRDSEGYNAGIARGAPLSAIFKDEAVHGVPGVWEYSNFGAGIAGAALECACGTDFETLMQETVFRPLGVTATYYPQKVKGDLADAVRILPPQPRPNYNAAERRARPLPPAEVNPDKHYTLAHGALCVSAPELARLGIAGMVPGFLSPESLREMRAPCASFGQRADNLSQGIGTFILKDRRLGLERVFYGHQGMAYGAVHGLFFHPETGRGISLLTTGASEARQGVLADLNFDLLKQFL